MAGTALLAGAMESMPADKIRYRRTIDRESMVRSGDAGVRGTIIAADDDDACLALLNRIHPALPILDNDMPRVTGFETLDNIRRNYPHVRCPVIFSAIHQTSTSVHRARELGAASFLIKPVDADTLVDRVGACLRRRPADYSASSKV